jgi:hypothetical protein
MEKAEPVVHLKPRQESRSKRSSITPYPEESLPRGKADGSHKTKRKITLSSKL